jgi:hypothetical protein
MKMNAPMRQQVKTPGIIIPGETVEQLIAHLGNAVLYAKSPDGLMRPFVDPLPVIQIISAALQEAQRNYPAGD